jgi:hypothetical protein
MIATLKRREFITLLLGGAATAIGQACSLRAGDGDARFRFS